MDKKQINSTCDLLDFWEDFDETMLGTYPGVLEEKMEPYHEQLKEDNPSQQIEFTLHVHTPYRVSVLINSEATESLRGLYEEHVEKQRAFSDMFR